MDLNALCNEHLKEGKTGALSFTKGFYVKLCKHLGIEYKSLSKLGKAVLKADAIETTFMNSDDNFKDKEYYISL